MQLPPEFCDFNIVHLEMLIILVARRVWGDQWSNQKLKISCDNEAVVAVLNSGQTKDRTLAAIAHNIKLQPWQSLLAKIIDIPMLHKIVHQCDYMYMGAVFKALNLTAFFSFVRISNLVPHSQAAYSPLYQLSRGDIFFAHPGVHILIKWTKTIQTKNTVKIIKLPSLGASPICPVAALKKLLAITPGHSNSPLFQIYSTSPWVPLIDIKVRRNLKSILQKLHLAHSSITFHSFRCSGATLAFNSNLALQDIQSHGTWTSDCVWRYITQDSQASHQVALAFQRQLLL